VVGNIPGNAAGANSSTNFWGQLSPTNYNNGAGASSSTYLSGSGTWTTPSGGGSANGVSNLQSTVSFVDVFTVTGSVATVSINRGTSGEVDLSIGSSTNLLVNAPVTATSFSGAGTGLTGTAAGLTAGGVSSISTNTVSSSQITTGLGYTPTTNTASGIVTALGYTPLGASSNAVSAATATTATYISTAVITNATSQASFIPNFANAGTNIIISPTNGNLQTWTLTNVSWAQMAAATTNWSESIRLEIFGSNTLTWTTTALSNTSVLLPSNSVSVILMEHPVNTNLWFGYRLR
jgi:hypothetical protein